ncbi:AbrB/MazE/SpoVT family DNA-binding domain-containing protein [Cyanobium sp. ATX 6F1]|uniref:AbrB/MazE/SpoVT family DNA-binding domain-containing protein n=1 Tax=unclassified Cyanobium TaxID=2627006 RepID=UPI0020CC8C22|nr:AbrB/MazE/SpoVT family DNA-binding domain-containing protein [Cyanobium sp. ATX 6F1]MCP9917508.1 AbrB/MazE/SpoVT family DNA-binding domain-containing protein [Cyanobium sp. ATX 6F1]
MVLAKRTSKNQLTLPKAVVEAAGLADYYDVVCEGQRIVLTPVHLDRARAVRERLEALGLSEADLAEAVDWSRGV